MPGQLFSMRNLTLRRAVQIAGIANLLYFAIEFAVAWRIGSVSLFADSVDFLEDACLNLLVFLGLSWSALNRVRLGKLLAGSIMLPALATLWVALNKFSSPVAPAASPLAATGLGALAVNLSCAVMMARFRDAGGSLTKAVYLSARNDVTASLAIIFASVLTVSTASFWPDFVVGIGIGFMNIDAARQVFSASRKELVTYEPCSHDVL